MAPIDIIDKTVTTTGYNAPKQTALEYALPGGGPSLWAGRVPVAGRVAAFMCADCGRILLYGQPKQS
jgi:hypothetical protein